MPSIPTFKFEEGVKQEVGAERALPFVKELVCPSVDTNTGRWANSEHKVFVKYLSLFGKDWRKISERIKTRSAVQVRTHAQKYFLKLRNAYTRKNKFLSEEENEILNKFVLRGVVENQPSGATTNNANLKRKRSEDDNFAEKEFHVRRRLSSEESNSKLQDKLSVAIKPIDNAICEEPDVLDLLHMQTLAAARESDFELNLFEPDYSEASEMVKPFIREPLWKYCGTESMQKFDNCGSLELGDSLGDDDCFDLLCVL